MKEQKFIDCDVCGRRYDINQHIDSFSSELKRHNMCFHCHFWMVDVGTSNYVIIDNIAYSIGEESKNIHPRGYGGRRFVIKRSNGCLIETTNLWNRGNVPDEFRNTFPNDAFFTYEKW